MSITRSAHAYLPLWDPSSLPRKLLPYTPYVISACYRSDIFSTEIWDAQPIGHTWEAEMDKRAATQPPEIRRLLCATARSVDQLEAILQAKKELYKKCGFNLQPATPINELSAKDQTLFLTTHLLDVLVWSFLSAGTETNLAFKDHPEQGSMEFIPRSGMQNYLAIEDKGIQDVLKRFIEVLQLSTTSDNGLELPLGLITAGPSTQDDTFPSDQDIRQHMSTVDRAVNHHSSAYTHLAISNMWLMVMSLVFVLHAHNDRYAARFKESIRKFKTNDQVKTILLEAMDKAGKTTQRHVILAAMGLCRTPVFLLKENVDITKFNYTNHQFTLPKIIPAVFSYLPATSERSVACEKAVWRHLGRLMALVCQAESSSSSLTIPNAINEILTVQFQGFHSDLLNATKQDGTIQRSIRSPWIHPRDRQGNSSATEGQQEQQAEQEEQDEDQIDDDDDDDNDDDGTYPDRPQRKRKQGSYPLGGSKPNKKQYLSAVPRKEFESRQKVVKPWIRLVEGSRYDWAPFIEAEGPNTQGLPPLEEERDAEVLEKARRPVQVNVPPVESPQTLEEEVTVLRYVVLEDNQIHRQWITFPLTWPKGSEGHREYAASLLANSRPATLQESLIFIDDAQGAETTKPAPAIHRLSDMTAFQEPDISIEERRMWDASLSEKPILFLPQPRFSRLHTSYNLPILDVTDIKENLRVDVYKTHEVQDVTQYDPTADEYFVAGSIQEVVKSNRRALNVLDIPNPTLCPPPVIQHMALETVGGCSNGVDGMRWNLCATQPALTRLHYDAGRLATWIRCLRGTKIWFILDGPLPKKGLAEVDVHKARFIYFVLEERSLFVMPPGIPHAALNVTDCIAEGGHLLLASALTKSFKVGLREHVIGHQDTNTSHISSESLLHSIWAHYELGIRNFLNTLQDRSNVTFDQVQQGMVFLPSLDNLAALVAMCIHPTAFEPSMPKGYHPPLAPWSMYSQRVSSLASVKTALAIHELWEPLTRFEDKIQDSHQGTEIARIMIRGQNRPFMRQ